MIKFAKRSFRILNHCVINRLTFVLIIIICNGFIGCTTYVVATHDNPPSNLDQIKKGVDRKTVERILGKPKKKDGKVYTYEYNKYNAPALWGAVLFDVMTFGTSAVYYGDFKKAEKAGKEKFKVVYGPKDKVISNNDDYDIARDIYLRWVISANRPKEFELLCISANNGYSFAQVIQAMRYRYGLYNTEIDRDRAYLWLKLADFGGRKNLLKVMTIWANNMTAKELKDAEKSFTNWEPESCDN